MNPTDARPIAERFALAWAEEHASQYPDEEGAATFGKACAVAFRVALIELERAYPEPAGAPADAQFAEVPPTIGDHVARMRELMEHWHVAGMPQP